MKTARHATKAELEAGLHQICRAPRESGTLELIVRRPRVGEREVLAEGELDPQAGLLGDNWRARGSRSRADGTANPDMQLNIMSARVIDLLADSREAWAAAGDQFFVDLDLSVDNLPAGTRLAVGPAVVEVTPVPHTGCAKFTARFGFEAMTFVNSPVGRELRLRGLNAKVVKAGTIRAGDVVRKLSP